MVFNPVNKLAPLGQGDGQGTVGKLVNPQAKNKAANNEKMDYFIDNNANPHVVTTDNTGVLDGTYSIYWSGLTDNNGTITVPNLVTLNTYFVEATSDPDNEGRKLL